MRRLNQIIVLVMIVGLSGCAQLGVFVSMTSPVEQLVPEVLSVRPHDPTAFTEGLIYVDGSLYESTGRYGQSTLRQVDPVTGQVEQQVALPADVFGEGLAAVDDQLVQLTWQEDLSFRYNRQTLALLSTTPYPAEGWGMCYDGTFLYTSDGSTVITVRDADSFATVRQIQVTLNAAAVPQINELECVGNSIYANVWHTDNIMRIDKTTGIITAVIDASGLLTPEQRAALTSPEAVLNGIAYDPDSDTFLITGKLWSWLFEVRFVPAS